jgi:cellulose biosynthesis protein BcsQ
MKQYLNASEVAKLLKVDRATVIPHSTIFARSYDEKTPVYKLEPQHPGSIAYDVLADWLITYNNENA